MSCGILVQIGTHCWFLWKPLSSSWQHLVLHPFLIVINFGYLAKIVTAETAFQNEKLDKEIYMEGSQGMSDRKRWIHHFKQVHLQPCFSGKTVLQKAVKILKNLAFLEGNANPCLSIKKSAKGIVFVALYVNCSILVGNDDALYHAIRSLNNTSWSLKVVEGLWDYVSCERKISKDKKRA